MIMSGFMKILVPCSLLLVCLVACHGDEPKKDAPQKGRNLLMQQKLTHAQKVLEGVAVQDFDEIEKNAEELILISKKAGWQVVQTPDYIRQSEDFRRNGEQLVKQAKAKNLDAAALSYVQMTLNCVNCHKYVRESRMAGLHVPSGGFGD